MKSVLILTASGLLALTQISCTPTERFTVGGVPGWLASGAIIEDEPEPYRPDNAIIVHEDESGPVNFELITDRKLHRTSAAKKKAAKPTAKPAADPIERGRDRRIRRLFH